MCAPYCLLLFVFGVGTATSIEVEGGTGRRRAANCNNAKELSLRQVVSQKLSLRQVASQMRYWSAERTKIPPSTSPVTYLLFDPDEAGLNNARMGWEMAGFAAAISGRTLVLPPAKAFHNVDTTLRGAPLIDRGEPMSSKVEDFIDLRQLKVGLPTLTFDEFVKKERRELESRGFSQKVPAYDAGGSREEIWGQWVAFATNELDRIPPNSECELTTWKNAGRFAYAPTITYPEDKYTRIFVCAAWWSHGEPIFQENRRNFEVPDWGYTLLKNNFVWHPRFYAMAAPVVKELGLFTYYAVHARYSDFNQQFPTEFRPFEAVADYMAKSFRGKIGLSAFRKDMISRGRERGEMLADQFRFLIPQGATLYISTDEEDPHFIQAFRDRGIKTVTWKQLVDQKDGPLARAMQKLTDNEKYSKWSGPTEQLICAFARAFVGTKTSTFSGYISRMRRYNNAPQKTPIYFNRPTSKADEENITSEIENWDVQGGISAFKANSGPAFLPMLPWDLDDQ